MPINQTLWDELWNRAEREEIGVFVKFANGDAAMNRLRSHRPAGFDDYTIARTPDRNIIFLVRPGVTINDEAEANVARQIFSDLE